MTISATKGAVLSVVLGDSQKASSGKTTDTVGAVVPEKNARSALEKPVLDVDHNLDFLPACSSNGGETMQKPFDSNSF